jgi:hypothetical protein
LSIPVERLGEVVRGDVHPFPEVEPVRIVALHARVEVDHRAAGGPGPGLEFGQQRVPDARGPAVGGGDEVVDVELADRERQGEDPPAGDADAPVPVVRDEEPKALRVALGVDRGEARPVQVRTQFPQHRQHVPE